MRSIGLAALLLFCLFLGWAGNPTQEGLSTSPLTWTFLEHPPLFFGVLPFQSEEILVGELKPLVSFLELHLRRPVKLVIPSDYHSLGKLLDLGRIQIAWFSTTSFESMNQGSWEVLCRPVQGGSIRHHGVIIARAGSGIASVEDLKGKRFAYVDRSSGSGFRYAVRLFRERGLDPIDSFAQVTFTGNHTVSLEGVLEGRFDGAAVFSSLPTPGPSPSGFPSENTAKGNGSEGSLLPAGLVALATTVPILNDPVVVRKDLEPELKAALRRLFFDAASLEGGRDLLSNLKTSRNIDSFIAETPIPDPRHP